MTYVSVPARFSAGEKRAIRRVVNGVRCPDCNKQTVRILDITRMQLICWQCGSSPIFDLKLRAARSFGNMRYYATMVPTGGFATEPVIERVDRDTLLRPHAVVRVARGDEG